MRVFLLKFPPNPWYHQHMMTITNINYHLKVNEILEDSLLTFQEDFAQNCHYCCLKLQPWQFIKPNLRWRSWGHFVKLLSGCTFSLHLLKSIESCRFSHLENAYQISCPTLQRTHYPIFSIINIIFNVLNQAVVYISPGFAHKRTDCQQSIPALPFCSEIISVSKLFEHFTLFISSFS